MLPGRAILVTAMPLVALTVRPAMADAIDGHWCHQDNRRISIEGPAIVTPGGSRITGNYARHSFTYVVPASEPGAGQTVAMSLMNEMTVHLRIGTDGAMQEWHRCGPPVSHRREPANAQRTMNG